MKYNRIIGRMISACAVLVALMIGVSASYAAYNAYLKLDGIKGEGVNIHKIVHSTTGKFDFGALPAGTYTIQLSDATGKPVKGSHTGWIEVNSSQYGVASAPKTGTGSASAGTGTTSAGMAIKGQGSATTSGSTQIDPYSGLAAGKRMHTPIVIKKEIDMSSPLTFSVPAGDVDKNGTTDIQATFTFQNVQGN